MVKDDRKEPSVRSYQLEDVNGEWLLSRKYQRT